MKLLRADELERGRVARDARPGSVAGRRRRSRSCSTPPRPLHALLRDQRTIAGIGRSWVDEILWEARLSPYKRGADLDADESARLREAIVETLGARDRPLRGGDRAADPRQAADAAARSPPRGRAVPALRTTLARGPLRGLRDRLLPRLPDGGAGAEGPAAVAVAALISVSTGVTCRAVRLPDACSIPGPQR